MHTGGGLLTTTINWDKPCIINHDQEVYNICVDIHLIVMSVFPTARYIITNIIYV